MPKIIHQIAQFHFQKYKISNFLRPLPPLDVVQEQEHGGGGGVGHVCLNLDFRQKFP